MPYATRKTTNYVSDHLYCSRVDSEQMQYQTIPVNPFAQKSSLIWCELPMEAAVVDQVRALNQLETAVKKAGISLTKVL